MEALPSSRTTSTETAPSTKQRVPPGAPKSSSANNPDKATTTTAMNSLKRQVSGHAKKAVEFFKSLGSPKHVVAPMVDQSEQAFRRLTRKYNAHLCYTPMFNSSKMVHDHRYMAETLQDLNGYTDGDRPLFVQLCGHKPDELLVAAKAVEHTADAVDLNLGCPQLIAKRGRYGAFLLEEFDLLQEIVTTLSENLDIPVTCKIRVLPSFEKTLELAKLLQASGCSVLTVHGRTKEEKGSKIGHANWEWIRRIKEELDIPVIANGSIGKFEDVHECLEATGCDAVMSSEGVLENPMLFAGPIDPGTTDIEHFKRRVELASEYLDLVVKHPPRCDKVVKKHIMAMVFGGFIHNKDLIQSVFKPRDVKGIRQAIDTALQRVLDREAQQTKVKSVVDDNNATRAGNDEDTASAEESERRRNFNRYAVLPNKEGRWYWRYRLREDRANRRVTHQPPQPTKRKRENE